MNYSQGLNNDINNRYFYSPNNYGNMPAPIMGMSCIDNSSFMMPNMHRMLDIPKPNNSMPFIPDSEMPPASFFPDGDMPALPAMPNSNTNMYPSDMNFQNMPSYPRMPSEYGMPGMPMNMMPMNCQQLMEYMRMMNCMEHMNNMNDMNDMNNNQE